MNPKQALFVKEYLIDLNAKQAAIRAGYSERSAESQASRLLRNAKVKAAIEKATGKVAAKLDITHEQICEELARIGFSDIGAFVNFGPDGIEIKDSSEVDTKCLAEVSETKTEKGGSVRFKLHSKVEALTELDDRLFGKPKQQVELSGALNLSAVTIVHE